MHVNICPAALCSPSSTEYSEIRQKQEKEAAEEGKQTKGA